MTTCQYPSTNPGNPKVVCDMVKCPDPYMGFDQPGAPPDPTKGDTTHSLTHSLIYFLTYLLT